MWFWMNKVVRIGIDHGTLLVWILNSCCLNHDDVTWDSSKNESSKKQGRERRKWDTKFYRRVRGVGGTCSKKP
jgi:hypothetical protein